MRGKCSALQLGQARFQPASTRLVAAPQFERDLCRACRYGIALASASGGEMIGGHETLATRSSADR